MQRTLYAQVDQFITATGISGGRRQAVGCVTANGLFVLCRSGSLIGIQSE